MYCSACNNTQIILNTFGGGFIEFDFFKQNVQNPQEFCRMVMLIEFFYIFVEIYREIVKSLRSILATEAALIDEFLFVNLGARPAL